MPPARATLQVHESEPVGDVLVFLPGQEDIEGLAHRLGAELDLHGGTVS